jgi:hypothetical protein
MDPIIEPIIVVVEGGAVQGVYRDQDTPEPVVVIDYDDEDFDDSMVMQVPQGNQGETAQAGVWRMETKRAHEWIEQFAHEVTDSR